MDHTAICPAEGRARSLHDGRDGANSAEMTGWYVTSLTWTKLWDSHLCSPGSGNEQENGAELCSKPVAPGALTKQAGMQQALRSRALREGQSSSALQPAALGMLSVGQSRAGKCSSTIKTYHEAAQEQRRQLTENYSSSKTPPFFWAVRTCT